MLGDLRRQFAGRLKDQRARHARPRATSLEPGQHRQHEGRGLAGSGLRDAEHVAAGDGDGDGFLLNGSRCSRSPPLQRRIRLWGLGQDLKSSCVSKIPRDPKRHAYLLSLGAINLLQRFAALRKIRLEQCGDYALHCFPSNKGLGLSAQEAKARKAERDRPVTGLILDAWSLVLARGVVFRALLLPSRPRAAPSPSCRCQASWP